MDTDFKLSEGRNLYTASDGDWKRTALLDNIEEKLKAYGKFFQHLFMNNCTELNYRDELLLREQRSQAMQRPRRQNFHALINYLWYRSEIDTVELDHLRQYDDLVLLAEDNDPIFHVLFENALNLCRVLRLDKLQVVPETRLLRS